MKREPEAPWIGMARIQSWDGVTEHQIRVIGRRRDGRLIAVWDDEPAFRRSRGSRIYPPPGSVRRKQVEG